MVPVRTCASECLHRNQLFAGQAQQGMAIHLRHTPLCGSTGCMLAGHMRTASAVAEHQEYHRGSNPDQQPQRHHSLLRPLACTQLAEHMLAGHMSTASAVAERQEYHRGSNPGQQPQRHHSLLRPLACTQLAEHRQRSLEPSGRRRLWSLGQHRLWSPGQRRLWSLGLRMRWSLGLHMSSLGPPPWSTKA